MPSHRLITLTSLCNTSPCLVQACPRSSRSSTHSTGPTVGESCAAGRLERESWSTCRVQLFDLGVGWKFRDLRIVISMVLLCNANDIIEHDRRRPGLSYALLVMEGI